MKLYIRLLLIKNKKHVHHVAVITQLYPLLFIVYQEESSIPIEATFSFMDINVIAYFVFINVLVWGEEGETISGPRGFDLIWRGQRKR